MTDNPEFKSHLAAIEIWDELTKLIELKHGVNPTTILRQLEAIGGSMVEHELKPHFNKGWEAFGISNPIEYIDSPVFEHILGQLSKLFDGLPEVSRGPINVIILSALIVCNARTVSSLHKSAGPITRKLDAIRFVSTAAYLHETLNDAIVQGKEEEKDG